MNTAGHPNDNVKIVLKPTYGYIFLVNFKHLLLFVAIIAIAEYLPEQYGFLKVLGIGPFLWAVWNLVYLRMVRYEITSTQIKYSRGIFVFKVDFLELYRVKDFDVYQTLPMRILKIMHLSLVTSDRSHPVLKFTGIRYSNIPDLIRELVLTARRTNKVYEID